MYLSSKGDKLTHPRAAFITFEFSDAVNLIQEMSKQEIIGSALDVKDPEIPSNIVWESRRWGNEEDVC
jgi:hypothetical protein